MSSAPELRIRGRFAPAAPATAIKGVATKSRSVEEPATAHLGPLIGGQSGIHTSHLRPAIPNTR
ncbi:putative nuclear receptor coactivator 6 [Mycobacterium canetti]|uniref:hypothetical protein n=1 Tax=Mycobacterium canetti TaxID=78331 RepID=UPI002D7692EE|nr:hypothetical protein [Mycobacterium canetti]WRO42891.1 putative nuclear receptor coactivator 6 [Mycobacterium canetti]